MSARLSRLTAEFLAMLENERGSSAHTVRADTRELEQFTAYLTKHFGASSAAWG